MLGCCCAAFLDALAAQLGLGGPQPLARTRTVSPVAAALSGVLTPFLVSGEQPA